MKKKKFNVSSNDKTFIPFQERQRDSVLVLPLSKNKIKVPNGDQFMDELHNVVSEANEIAYYGNALALYHVTRNLEHFGKLSHPLDKDFFNTCLCLVNNGSKPTLEKAKEYGLIQSYCELFDCNEEKLTILFDYKNHGGIPLYTAINMETVMNNYNEIAIFDHMVHYIKAKYYINRTGHVKFIITRFTSKDPHNFEFRLRNFPYDEETLRRIITLEAAIWQNHKDGKRNEYRYKMLRKIEARCGDIQSYKKFTLIPMRTNGIKFIDLDIFTMKLIWSRIKPCRISKKNTDIENELLDEWQWYYDENVSMCDWFTYPKRGNGFEPGKMIRTNSYEIHYLYEKGKIRNRAGRVNKTSKNNMLEETDWDPSYEFKNNKGIDVSNYCNFAAADVGHHNMFTVASPDGTFHKNGSLNMEIRNYTKKKYNNDSLRNIVNKRSRRLGKNKKIQQIMNLLSCNSMKTTSAFELSINIHGHLKYYKSIYNHFKNHQFQKLKVRARMMEKKTIDDMIHWITWGGTKPLGIGDGSKTTGFKCTSPGGPIRKIRRHANKKGYEINLVKEAYTSKRSSCCAGYDCVAMKNENGDSIHGVRICQKCGKTLDRDINSSFQIFHIFYKSQVLRGARPEQYQNNYVREQCTEWWLDTLGQSGPDSHSWVV
jgi:transposase